MINNRQYPPVTIVDENDNEIGTAMLAEAWNRGLYHRIATIFVLDDTGRMLLQLRGPQVGYLPNHWDQAAGGHVDAGYSYEETAAAELEEEIGVGGVHLEVLGTVRTNNTLPDGRIINRFERAYVVHVPHDIVLTPEDEEIDELRWFTPDELKTWISDDPARFTPGLLEGLRAYFPNFRP